jgi:putative membrane protein insertion efficiency factor
MAFLGNIVRNFFIYIVKLYRAALSPLLGSNCKFHPTCSQYCIDAFESLPVARALFLSINRVLRCNPLSLGGPDPVQK